MNQEALIAVLREMEPFAHLNPDELLILAGRSETCTARRKARIFELGQQDHWMFFVLEGTVQLVAADGREMTVDGATRAALRPLAQLQPRRYLGVAATAVSYLRVDTSGLGRLQPVMEDAQYLVEELDEDVDMEAMDLVHRYQRVMEKGDFQLPSLPHIALDATRAIDRDDADADDLAKILINDPPITAKLIKAANSPLFHGLALVDDCDKAIIRLGMKTSRQLIVAFAMRELFNVKVPALRQRMDELWRHSTEVAAIAMVLSRELRCLDPDQAMVAGLLHDIGIVPILKMAADDEGLLANETALDLLIAERRGEMGSRLLGDWNFPQPLIAAAREANDWWRDPAPAADYADIVIIAQLHSFLGRRDAPDVPHMVKLPAFRKVTARTGLDPAKSMTILEAAQDAIQEARSLLAG